MPGSFQSAAYIKVPLTFCTKSWCAGDFPTILNSGALLCLAVPVRGGASGTVSTISCSLRLKRLRVPHRGIPPRHRESWCSRYSGTSSPRARSEHHHEWHLDSSLTEPRQSESPPGYRTHIAMRRIAKSTAAKDEVLRLGLARRGS